MPTKKLSFIQFNISKVTSFLEDNPNYTIIHNIQGMCEVFKRDKLDTSKQTKANSKKEYFTHTVVVVIDTAYGIVFFHFVPDYYSPI